MLPLFSLFYLRIQPIYTILELRMNSFAVFLNNHSFLCRCFQEILDVYLRAKCHFLFDCFYYIMLIFCEAKKIEQIDFSKLLLKTILPIALRFFLLISCDGQSKMFASICINKVVIFLVVCMSDHNSGHSGTP